MQVPLAWKAGSHSPHSRGRASRGMGRSPGNQESLSLLEQPQDVDPESVGVAAGLRRLARGTGPVLDAGNVVGTQGKQAIFGHGRLPRPVQRGMAEAYAAPPAGFELPP
jgi:hypothetical protein